MKALPVLVGLLILASGCISSQGIPTTKQGVQVRQNPIFGPQPGEQAPAFTVTTTDARTISLDSLTQYKKPVVLYFFATWCSTCIEDLKQAKQVYPAYANRIEFIAADLDLEENKEVIDAFVKRYGFEGFRNFALPQEQLLVDYRITQTSTKYLINRDGIVVFSHSGATNTEGWKRIFESLLQ
ncbi:MAG: TlpA family protein disulfide reductase [Candidatus Aenigmarchaeota archaeon]|nr:TlpA family protein disulfide reductase [Candidatus Aenigmarchaeota archaeon]